MDFPLSLLSSLTFSVLESITLELSLLAGGGPDKNNSILSIRRSIAKGERVIIPKTKFVRCKLLEV